MMETPTVIHRPSAMIAIIAAAVLGGVLGFALGMATYGLAAALAGAALAASLAALCAGALLATARGRLGRDPAGLDGTLPANDTRAGIPTRLYFDIERGDDMLRDEVGVETTNVEGAVSDAQRAIKESLGELAPGNKGEDWVMVARDGRERVVAHLPILVRGALDERRAS